MLGKEKFFFLGGALLAATLLPAQAAAKPEMPHIALYKAIYTMNLVSTAPNSIVAGVGGEMYYEQDDSCHAWTTEQRLATHYDYSSGASVNDAARYAAFESKDGKHFSFNAQHQENGKTDQQIGGSVTRAADGTGNAVYTLPDGTQYALPKGYFLPVAHTIAIIRHAEAGEHFFNAVLFDGTDAAGAAETSVFIGKKETAAERKKIADSNKYIDAKLLAPQAWHVRIAIFPLKDKWTSTPAYEMDMILGSNGVVSHVVVHYKNFAVAQRLIALAPLPAVPCR